MKTGPALRIALVAVVFFLGFHGAAWAATVTADLVGTFPIQITPGATVANAFAVRLGVAGTFPKTQSGGISVCSSVTLHADGTSTCTNITIPLTPGTNYTRNPSGFPQNVPVSVTCDADVVCGLTYTIDELVSLDVTGGADFGDGITSLVLPFDVQVNCVDPQQGCSLGFWKNHLDAWPSPYESWNVLGSAFTYASQYGLQSATFLDALNYSGGNTLTSKAQLLLKQAVAALLNAAAGIDYPLTTSQVVTEVNTALASGNGDTMLALQSVLDGYNNLSCPLGGAD